MENGPSLRLERVHVRGLRGLASLNLPEEGFGWGGRFPDVAMLGGANGSGKTTFLQAIADAGHAILQRGRQEHRLQEARELRLDFSLRQGQRVVAASSASRVTGTPLEAAEGQPLAFRFVVGDTAFVEANRAENTCGFVASGHGKQWFSIGVMDELGSWLTRAETFHEGAWPRMVYFPSDNRELLVPVREKFQPVVLQDEAGFVAAWNRGLGTAWKGSTVELLFAARWADLNAKEEGRLEDATQFLNFTQAFSDMTGGSKQIGWSAHGELVVKLAEGGTHPLDELSAGERQVLLLLAELRRTWRPGSLVLIDEPELHLHDAWQGQLYDILRGMQRELGGQVILTTQSHSLFEMAETGSRALLGRSGMT